MKHNSARKFFFAALLLCVFVASAASATHVWTYAAVQVCYYSTTASLKAFIEGQVSNTSSTIDATFFCAIPSDTGTGGVEVPDIDRVGIRGRSAESEASTFRLCFTPRDGDGVDCGASESITSSTMSSATLDPPSGTFDTDDLATIDVDLADAGSSFTTLKSIRVFD